MTTTFIPLPPLSDPESGREIFQITAQRVAQAELYDITNPVEGDQFFGRDQLLTNLETCVNSGSAFGLFGMRKTGKTSVVNMLRQKLEKTAELEREQLVCDADLEGLPAIQDLKIGQLVAEVAKGIKLAARRKGLRVEELSNLSAQPTINEFDNALRHLLQSRSYKGVSVLLVLDEVEHICSPEAPHIVGSETERKVVEFLGVLRKISKDYSQSEYQGSNFGSFNLGFVGLANAIIEEHTLYGRENPLFRFARTFYLEPLSLEESASLLNQIGSRRGLIWDSEAVRQAAQVSGGNVTLLRTLASAVAKRKDQTAIEVQHISAAEVNDVSAEYLRASKPYLRQARKYIADRYPDEGAAIDMLLDKEVDFSDLVENPEFAHLELERLGLVELRSGRYAESGLLTALVQIHQFARRRATLASGSAVEVSDLIEAGEGDAVEFKTSLVVPVHEGQPEKVIVDQVIKSVMGFLNSRGGTLLIGVEDDGTVRGIEPDIESKGSRDKLGLFLVEKLNFHLGAAGVALLSISWPTPRGRQLIRIDAEASPKAIFCEQEVDRKKGGLFVRQGPRTKFFDGREAFEYANQNGLL
ncbi:RNA-binding domain-containing protein [Dietzia maris]|uniref:RNA-binding domain-containing protein n=1 Tax=Dietzia maris TaxID=37915 RepID=UPI0037C737A0